MLMRTNKQSTPKLPEDTENIILFPGVHQPWQKL